ncbi:NAD(P)H dehydrogenase (quinone) [Mucilaginibacter frigoritolerans]|uniref:NAD(P)H dehydrogenase (Quinone) n=1 Tax=Mucilaginibacter frigoritolerans TaxID=652788 RepID=A0A562UBK9_9SPHI|nr:SDR family oxidoreductase [Mucilaginibacter frigoritolerans]TWJ03173.1 NAD(P)H dehydrogenase (quinone) [Mucilaginibacter frigoritolerans]
MKNILVTGATGPLGMGVITTLLSKTSAKNVYALARSEEKAASLKELGVNVKIGDYDDYESLVNAFNEIDTLYMVSNTDVAKRITQQDNVVEAALETGVTHIVYTSYLRKTETEDSPIRAVAAGHLNTEAKLKESGITYTILKHGTYTEMIPVFAGYDVLTKHLIYVPAGDGKTSFVTRNELAEAGAIILLDETGKYANKSLELTGPKALSWGDVADIIGSITNLPIKYISPSEDEYKKVAIEAGVPAGYVNLFANFSKVTKDREVDKTTGTLEDVLGYKATTVEISLKKIYGNK